MKISCRLSLYFLALSSAICFTASGQTLVKGHIQEDNGKPFPFANVLLLSAKDSTLVKGMLSGESGLYSFENIKPGAYLIATSAVGFRKTYSPTFSVEAAKNMVQVNTLVLEGSNKELKEVQVMALKPLFEQHLDRLIVNVQNSITAAGATALDVLERSPGISVNRQNNSISMSGKEGVVVMINGKITRLPTEAVMQVLRGMNAGNIQKIELITTPSAQYDAEGNAGIINIVLSKSSDMGTNGSYSGTLGYGWYEKAAASANLNHRSAKLNLFGDGSYSWDHYMFQVNNTRKLMNQGQWIESNMVSKRYTYHSIYNGRIGFDYLLGGKTTLSGLLSGFSNKQEQFCKNNSQIYQAQEIFSRVWMEDHEINHWRNFMGNLNLRQLFRNNQEVNIDLDYLFYHQRDPHWYLNNYQYIQDQNQEQEQITNSKLTPIHMWVGKVDYVKNISKKTKLETGVKGTLSRLKNEVIFQRLNNQTWQIDPEFGQNVKMQEDISAAYLNFGHQLTAKTKVQTGLRWESTYTNLTAVTGENLITRHYHNLFPSAFLSHELSKNHDLQLAYSRRITRPTFNDLAPFVTFLDPYTFITGNTNLKPTITNGLQAVYQFKKQYLFSFQYSHDNNAIAWMVQVDPEQNEQYITKENINSSDTYSLNLSIPVTLTPWWQMQNNLMGNWQENKTRYQGENFRISGGYGRLNTTQNFTLPNGYSLELTYLYQTRALMGIGYRQPFGFLNAGIQKKLKNNRGILRLTGSDLFWTQRLGIITKNPAINQDLAIAFKFEPRVVRLTYSHNFGNKNLKVQNNRRTGSEEERNRVTN